MKRYYKLFDSIGGLNVLIDQYFEYIKGEYEPAEEQPKPGKTKSKSKTEKICIREPEPPTLAGLILYLGFNSKEEFDNCATTSRYSASLQRAQLQIAAALEQKLHRHSGGAIYALKSMALNERPGKPKTAKDNKDAIFRVEVTQSGPLPASNEKEVIL